MTHIHTHRKRDSLPHMNTHTRLMEMGEEAVDKMEYSREEQMTTCRDKTGMEETCIRECKERKRSQ